MPAGKLSRLFRAVGFTTACVALSASGHELMGGRPLPIWAPLLGAALLLPPVYALACRQRGYPSIAAAMLGGELGLHELFSAAQHMTASAGGVPRGTAWLSVAICGGGRVLVPVRGTLVSPGTWPRPISSDMSGMTAVRGMPIHSRTLACGHGAMAMVAAHVIAGLLCAWWLRHGETAAFGLLWTIGMSLLAPVRLATSRLPTPLTRPGLRPACLTVPRPSRRPPLAHVVVRRGPPLPVAAL